MTKLKSDADPAAVAAVQAGMRAMDLPGCVGYTVGNDLGLRDGNWSFAIVADFVDEAAYRAYDLDAEHNRLRAALAPWVEQIARLQFELAA